jgi:hypothetical protein
MKTGSSLQSYFTLLNLLCAVSASSCRQFGMRGREKGLHSEPSSVQQKEDCPIFRLINSVGANRRIAHRHFHGEVSLLPSEEGGKYFKMATNILSKLMY